MPWDPPELDWLPPEAQQLLRFACTRMVHSYKPVLMLAIMAQLPATEIPASVIAEAFVAYYVNRERQGLPVERRGSRFMAERRIDQHQCGLTAVEILRLVFWRQQGILLLDRDTLVLQQVSAWRLLHEPQDISLVSALLKSALDDFFERMVLRGEAAYGQQQPNSEADPVVLFLPDPDDRDDLHLLWPEDS